MNRSKRPNRTRRLKRSKRVNRTRRLKRSKRVNRIYKNTKKSKRRVYKKKTRKYTKKSRPNNKGGGLFGVGREVDVKRRIRDNVRKYDTETATKKGQELYKIYPRRRFLAFLLFERRLNYFEFTIPKLEKTRSDLLAAERGQPVIQKEQFAMVPTDEETDGFDSFLKKFSFANSNCFELYRDSYKFGLEEQLTGTSDTLYKLYVDPFYQLNADPYREHLGKEVTEDLIVRAENANKRNHFVVSQTFLSSQVFGLQQAKITTNSDYKVCVFVKIFAEDNNNNQRCVLLFNWQTSTVGHIRKYLTRELSIPDNHVLYMKGMKLKPDRKLSELYIGTPSADKPIFDLNHSLYIDCMY